LLVAELPRGTVTFLFTDIEGSTRLLKHLGERYSAVLGDHRRILREAAEAREGREIDTQGDSFFFAFARANAALGAAVVAQRALAEHEWPEGGEVRVRMGLHTGEPVVGEERYVGLGVHRAARIGAAAHGGQVLLSNATRELVEEEVGGVSVRELGAYRLKDIDRPERLFQLDIAGLQTDFPPLKAEKIAEPRSVRRRTVLIAMLAGVIAAAVAIPIFAFGQGGGGSVSIDAAAGNSVGFVDPASNKLVADVEVGTTPTDVAVGEGAVWVTNSADGTVDRIDPVSQTVRQTIRVGHGPDGIAIGEGSVWVVNGLDGTVSRIDPRSSEVTQTISVGNGPSGIAVGRDKVWVVNQDDRTVSRIDPVAGKVAGTFTVGSGPVDIAVGPGGLWVTSETEGKVLHIDPGTGGILDSVPVGRGPGAIAVTPSAVWVANELDGTVSRVDPGSATVSATIPVGKAPSGIAAVSGAVWVADSQDGSLDRIDPAVNRVSKQVSIGSSPTAVAGGPGGVFVAVRPARGAHRGGTLTLLNQGWYAGTLDPAVTVSPLLNMTNDGLTAFKRVGGREGTEVVPDLAVSLPQPSDAGRTYTFRLRKGIRYSNGKLVRAGDFRRAIERNFQLEGDYTWLWTAILGAAACSRHPMGCDFSRGIVADDHAGTITFRLTEPDPDFLFKLALPYAFAVPQDTPGREVRRHPLPATGPYRISAFVPRKQIRLVRNPRFREWSRTARPDGYPDVIVLMLDSPVPAAVRAVGAGRADVADLSNSGEADLSALRARYGARLHSVPTSVVVYTTLNTRVKPFDDVRVRKALSYALDRKAVVDTAGGPLYASPSCQLLPANFPGYRPYCPHRRDLAEARRLVAESGSRGTPVVVWTRASYRQFYAHVVAALRKLGYPARLKVIDPDNAYLDALRKAGPDKVQASYIGWVTDYPSAGNFVTSLLSYLEPATSFSDPAIKRQISRAQKLQQTDQTAANAVWARIDRMITDQAPVVPMYNVRGVALVSERVGNFQYHPFWFTLLDQLWVR
jgi:YVTN family beta-propeller protein